jgi:hypothetical protein
MKSFFRPVIGIALAAMCMVAGADPIRAFGPDSMQRIVDAHRGEPFVLVLWSLDCAFCGESFHTLEQARLHRKDFAVVTVSTDPVDDPELGPLIREHLSKFGMDHDAWAFGALPPERLRYAIDRSWHGEKPRSYWFNARGERVAYSGVITAAVIDKYLKQ